MYYECRHIMPNGARCHSPALREKDYCYFHARLHSPAEPSPAAPEATPAAVEPRKLPVLEDRSAILVALSQVVNDLNSKRLDPRRAGQILFALQIASQNVERRQDVLPFFGVRAVFPSPEGQEIASELRICEEADECSACEEKDTCKAFQPEEDEDDDDD